MALVECRGCQKEVSVQAHMCPHCGAPFPARKVWYGWGRDWKSKTTILGIPLIHIAYGRTPEGRWRVAKGVIAIGQFGIGLITFAQVGFGLLFGIGQVMFGLTAVAQVAIAGLLGVGQIAIGPIAVGQVAIGVYGLAQAGILSHPWAPIPEIRPRASWF